MHFRIRIRTTSSGTWFRFYWRAAPPTRSKPVFWRRSETSTRPGSSPPRHYLAPYFWRPCQTASSQTPRLARPRCACCLLSSTIFRPTLPWCRRSRGSSDSISASSATVQTMRSFAPWPRWREYCTENDRRYKQSLRKKNYWMKKEDFKTNAKFLFTSISANCCDLFYTIIDKRSIP